MKKFSFTLKNNNNFHSQFVFTYGGGKNFAKINSETKSLACSDGTTPVSVSLIRHE